MEISDLEKVNNGQSQKWYGTDIESVARAPGSANNYCDVDDEAGINQRGHHCPEKNGIGQPHIEACPPAQPDSLPSSALSSWWL